MLNLISKLAGGRGVKVGPIGLDLGRDSIKMLQLIQTGSVLSVSAAARWQFPDNVAEDSGLWRRFAVDAVKDMLATKQFKGREVVTCLPVDHLTLKQVRLPRMPEKDLRAAVQWEASERFNFKVQNDLLHYLVAGEVRQGTECRDEVILMGASAEQVDEHLTLLDDMKLRAEAVDAEPLALFRPYERFHRRQDDAEDVMVLLDVGMNSTRVLIARGRQLAFIKTIGIGNRQLNQAVASNLTLNYDEAVQMRLSLMQDEQGIHGHACANEQIFRAAYDAIRATAEELAREIGLCLRYYAVTFRGIKPGSVTLTGGAVYDPCLRTLLKEHLGIDCALGRPLQGMDLSLVDLSGDRRGLLCEWNLSTGLALRQLTAALASEPKDERNRLSA